MVKLKTLLPYIFGLMSLIISFGLVSQAKPAQGERLLSPTPTATPLPKPEPFLGAARLARCQALSQPRFFFYVPALTTGVPHDLIISGTVYASDLSPLPNALVEVWQQDDNQMNQPPFSSVAMRTDKAGHYEFTTKFNRLEQFYLHYRITHRDYCSLLIYLHPVVESQPKPAKEIFAQVVINGPVLHGPVDIVMPVASLP